MKSIAALQHRGSSGALCLLLLLTGLVTTCGQAPPEDSGSSVYLELGTLRQLFFDDALVASKEGFEITANPAVRTESPVLSPETPWERYGIHVESVMAHDGLYKLWYGARGEDQVARLCYAISTDGIQWTRPSLGVVEYPGSKNNNIVFTNVGNVFLDPSAPADRRFKMICGRGKYTYPSVYDGGARFRYDKDPPAGWHYAGIGGAYSPDGIHWTFTEKESILPWYTDTMNVAF